jgi:formylglycine-generating enzyme required for sulfatase activity
MGGEEFVVQEPEHNVYLNSYYLGIYEVAKQRFLNVMEYNPSRFKRQELPAENVSWLEADAYFRTFAGRFY